MSARGWGSGGALPPSEIRAHPSSHLPSAGSSARLRVINQLRPAADPRAVRRRLRERLDISPGRMRLIEMLTALVCALHAFTCAYWRVKIESSTDDEVYSWLVKYSVDPSNEASRRPPPTHPRARFRTWRAEGRARG